MPRRRSTKRPVRASKPKRGDIVHLEWEDAYSSRQDIPHESYVVHSFGHLLEASPHVIRIAQSKRDGCDEYTDVVYVPRTYVRSLRTVERYDRTPRKGAPGR